MQVLISLTAAFILYAVVNVYGNISHALIAAWLFVSMRGYIIRIYIDMYF